MKEFDGFVQSSEQEKEDVSASVLGKYLTFWIDAQLYGMPIAEVVQIIGVRQIIPMPEYPDYAKGIINMRGSIIPVIDIRIRLHMEEKEYNERTCIIVTNIDNKHVGFIVDAVDEVTVIQKGEIEGAPKLGSGYCQQFITNIGKLDNKVVLLLDARKVICADVA